MKNIAGSKMKNKIIIHTIRQSHTLLPSCDLACRKCAWRMRLLVSQRVWKKCNDHLEVREKYVLCVSAQTWAVRCLRAKEILWICACSRTKRSRSSTQSLPLSISSLRSCPLGDKIFSVHENFIYVSIWLVSVWFAVSLSFSFSVLASSCFLGVFGCDPGFILFGGT